jgi:predicted DNA-binding transcriptional regulator AlpA
VPDLLTLEEIAAQVRVPIATLRYWRSRGEGPETFRLGRRVVAYQDAVDAWVQERADRERSRHQNEAP